MGGVKNVEKRTPPFVGSKIMNVSMFFDFEPKNSFRVPTPWGFVGGVVGRALIQLMHFSAIFAMLAVLATWMIPWYPL